MPHVIDDLEGQDPGKLLAEVPSAAALQTKVKSSYDDLVKQFKCS